MATHDKGFWLDLEQAFLAVRADDLRADYACDRSSSPHWELTAWSDPLVRDRFEVEAARAGSALRQPEASSSPRDRWLNLLRKKKPEWLEPSRIEDNVVSGDDSERRTVTGTIHRVIEKSAFMCRLLQSEAGLAIGDGHDDSPRQETPVAITEMEGTAGTIFEGLSATGIANFRTADSQDAYQNAYADFAPASDEAFTREIPPGKPSSHLGLRAAVVHLSRNLEKLTEKYFEKFATGIDDNVREAAAEGPDPVLTPVWRHAVIQEYTKKLWGDVDAVWNNWLAQIRKMTGGAAFGQRVLPIGDPEYEILTAHRRRITGTLYSIAHRYSIPKDTIREILDLDDIRRTQPPGRYTGNRLAREVEGEPAPKANQDTVDRTTLGARESVPNAVPPSVKQQEDMAIQKALDILKSRPEWPQSQLSLIQAEESLMNASDLDPWQRALNYYRATGKAWLEIVSDNETLQAFYTILPVIMEGMYWKCLGITPDTFRATSPPARQFERDLRDDGKDFRKRAAERALRGPKLARKTASELLTESKITKKFKTHEKQAEAMGIERSVYFDLKAGRKVGEESYIRAARIVGCKPEDLKPAD